MTTNNLQKLQSKIFHLLIKVKNYSEEENKGVKKHYLLLRDRIRLSLLLSNLQSKESGEKSLATHFLNNCYKYLQASKGQIFQDIFALTIAQEKKSGFFVEFGATNGVKLNNSYLLEAQFSWSGILAEPGRGWQEELATNRKCTIDTRCVFSKSGEEILFTQHSDPELSGITNYLGQEANNQLSYAVPTVSLQDLLVENNAPNLIDYFSIDTEGSEFDILNAFDFSKFTFKCITVEHNYHEIVRQKIYQLLIDNGYQRVLEHISAHDDWYIYSKKLAFSLLVPQVT